jgi:hypothetical protein
MREITMLTTFNAPRLNFIVITYPDNSLIYTATQDGSRSVEFFNQNMLEIQRLIVGSAGNNDARSRLENVFGVRNISSQTSNEELERLNAQLHFKNIYNLTVMPNGSIIAATARADFDRDDRPNRNPAR